MKPRIPENIANVRERTQQFEEKYQREPGSVTLLAVSKTRGPEEINAARQAGQLDFGENYLQEALEKITALDDSDLRWHFIGPIQSNKTRAIAENFAWVHSVDRIRIARRLSEQRPPGLPPLKVLLQVKLDNEDSKAGAPLAEIPALAREVAALPNLELRGLMVIPAAGKSFEEQRNTFRELAHSRDILLASGLTACTELSMGMSDDFEAAIAEGATIIRLGTALFGSRN